MTDEEIFERFYAKYWRSPNYDEYVKCGGTLGKVEFFDFIKFSKYELPNNQITYEVLDLEGKRVFVGTQQELANELDIPMSTISGYANKDKIYRKNYIFKKVPFNGLDEQYIEWAEKKVIRMDGYEALAFLIKHCKCNNGEEYFMKGKANDVLKEILNGYELYKQSNYSSNK